MDKTIRVLFYYIYYYYIILCLEFIFGKGKYNIPLIGELHWSEFLLFRIYANIITITS